MDLGFEIQKANFGIRINILEIPCVPIFRWNGQIWLFWPKFFDLNFQFLVANSEKKCQNKNQLPWDTMCSNFQTERTTLTFLAQICPKRIFGLEIQETYVGKRISILEISCLLIFRQNGQLWLFGSKFAQKWILGSEFRKSKSGFVTSKKSSPRYHLSQFSIKMDNFEFFGLNFGKSSS